MLETFFSGKCSRGDPGGIWLQINYKIFLKIYKFVLTNCKLGFTITSVYRKLYNTVMKEDANMKKRIIAIALVIVMLFALSACGKKQEAAPAPTEAPAPVATEAPATEAPAAETEAPAAEAPAVEASEKTVEEVIEANGGIEPDSGVYTITSVGKSFSIDYDSKYVANELVSGNIMINAGTDEGIPYCTVSLFDAEITGDAVTYLQGLGESAMEELGKDIETEPGEPKAFSETRDLYFITFSFKDKDAGGNVRVVYYAENLDSGELAVFESRALEGDTQAVDEILQLATQTFRLAI